MKLKIRNLAKVGNAEIDINGLTVIAGSNNTGKSTVGKTIFSIFNSLNDIERRVQLERYNTIRSACQNSIRNALSHRTALGESSRLSLSFFVRVSRNIATQIVDIDSKENVVSFENIKAIVTAACVKHKIPLAPDEFDELIKEIYSKTYDILQLAEETISKLLVTRYFVRVFNEQINPLHKEEKAIVELELKKRRIAIEFFSNKCSLLDTGISILHKAVYLDNPFAVDQLDDAEFYGGSKSHLVELLSSYYDDENDHTSSNQLIEFALAEEKMGAIFQKLSSVVKGRILVKDGNYYLEDEDIEKTVSVKNLSSGLKAFVLLKMLVESGAICDNDVLILDEPEIHLHPEWQVVYAELIVLLQKYLNLSVIVTTHSPYFLDAIDLFSRKHGIENKTNYYLSKIVENQAEFREVSDCIDEIYKEMASPMDVLETLRYELTEE